VPDVPGSPCNFKRNGHLKHMPTLQGDARTDGARQMCRVPLAILSERVTFILRVPPSPDHHIIFLFIPLSLGLCSICKGLIYCICKDFLGCTRFGAGPGPLAYAKLTRSLRAAYASKAFCPVGFPSFSKRPLVRKVFVGFRSVTSVQP